MNSFAMQNTVNYSTSTINTTASTSTSTSTFECTELATLLNIIMKLWKEQPNHFGFPKFDDFLKKLPEYYYQLIQQYQQQMIRLQQQQQQQQLQQQMQQNTQQNVLLLKSQNNNNNNNILKSKPEEIEIDSNNKSVEPQQPQNQAQAQIQEQTQESVLKSTQTKRGYKVRASKKPRLEAIEEEKPLSPSPSISPLPSPSVSPSPPSNERLNAFAPEFVPNDESSPSSSPQPQISNISKSYSKLQAFVPKHAARAKLNIYIPKHMTKGLLAMIAESFPNTNTLYYYLDISTALQINDKQMEIIETKSGDKIVIVNFDLHKRETNELLYAVVTPNDQHKIETNTQKWLWKLDAFLTEDEIYNKYEILFQDFPKSSRLMNNGIYQKFAEQYHEINKINNNAVNLLRDYEWELNEIKIIGSSQKSKKGKKAQEVKLDFNKNEWINQVLSSWNNNFPLIPIVVYENRDINQHWIEWVKLIYIQKSQSFIGITFKYNDNNNKWQIESIVLDKGDIHNKHRLIGLQNIESRHNINYDQYFDNFNTKITEIEWR